MPCKCCDASSLCRTDCSYNAGRDTGTPDVAAAVQFAKAVNLTLAVKGGGLLVVCNLVYDLQIASISMHFAPDQATCMQFS